MKLLDRVAETGARRHLSPLTAECYQRWIRDFLAYWAHRSAADSHVVLCGAEGEVDVAAGLLLGEPTVSPSKLNWRHPRELGAAEVGSFLTHLAVERRLSASTQNQATNAKIMGVGNLALGVWVSPSLWI
jgi:hypothetical protein